MTTNEPEYRYVKGRGWVPQSTTGHIVTMLCGTVVRLENRVPLRSERYDAGSISPNWGTQEFPNWDAWVTHFANHKYTDMCYANGVISERTAKNDVYIVAVPIDRA